MKSIDKNTDYDMLQFCIVDCIKGDHQRDCVTQELDEFYQNIRKRSDLTSDAMNVISRYEFMKKGI